MKLNKFINHTRLLFGKVTPRGAGFLCLVLIIFLFSGCIEEVYNNPECDMEQYIISWCDERINEREYSDMNYKNLIYENGYCYFDYWCQDYGYLDNWDNYRFDDCDGRCEGESFVQGYAFEWCGYDECENDWCDLPEPLNCRYIMENESSSSLQCGYLHKIEVPDEILGTALLCKEVVE